MLNVKLLVHHVTSRLKKVKQLVIHKTHEIGVHVFPFYFFLWGYVKDQVYVPPLPASIAELKVRIRTANEAITADMLQTRLSC